MENLKLTSYQKLSDESFSSGLNCFTVDSLNKLLYGVTKTNHLVSINLNSGQAKNCCDLSNDKTSGSNAIAIEFFMENESLNIYFENGIILGYSINLDKLNCIGSVENGIAAVASSPDQDYVALISHNDQLFLFTQFFDILVEKDLHAKHAECIEKLDVGWGSKQTQFHGTEGKQAAKAQTEPVEASTPWDDGKKRIFWRGDGLYFVTSAIHPEKNYRVLRVWNNEGMLQYESEYVAGLEHSLAWRPEGNLIGSSRYFKDKHSIVFFEKNGLKHLEFDLLKQSDSFVIKHLVWSTDSKVLLVHGYDNNKELHSISLYTMRNYHWYLKQYYTFDDKIECLSWDSSNSLTLYLSTSLGYIMKYSFSWAIDCYADLVAVIDGCKLQMTPFKSVNIPPPMSAYSIVFEQPVNDVHLYSSSNLLVKTSKGIFSTLDLLTESLSEISAIKIESGVRNNAPKPNCIKVLHNFKVGDDSIHHIRAINDKEIIGIRQNEFDFNKDDLIVINLESLSLSSSRSFSLPVLAVDFHKPSNTVVFELSDNSLEWISVKEQNFSNLSFPVTSKNKFPKSCESMRIVSIESELHIVGLTANGTLFFNDRPFLTNICSSFLIHQEKYLVTTGHDNFLRCNLLNSQFIREFLPATQDPRDEPRNIERGSKLVTSIDDDARVILQMPRGNLEPIYPRTLLLDFLKQLLNNHKFGEAFNVMKKHRINMNLFVDHDWINFSTHVDKIIDEIGADDIQNICLFLSEIKEENITQTMYKAAYFDKTSDSYQSSEYQPSDVFWLMRSKMKLKDPNRYLIPILVTCVKEKVPRIDKALKRIYYKCDPSKRDEALRYLFYLIDVENLYKEALGTYDFDIVLMVAEKSNKDPKEYHAYLNKLQSIENETYRKFKIDVDLKRFDKALININQLKDYIFKEECIAFIESNRLYWSAVKTISGDHPWITTIWEKFGGYLLVKRYYEEAGIAYQRANSLHNAIKAYQLSENWNTALELATTIKDYDLEPLCRSLVTRLKTNGKYSQAAYIEETYLNDKPSAILTLIEGHKWDKANRLLAATPNKPLASTLKTQLLSQYEKFSSNITMQSHKLEEYINRLKIVEETKIKTYLTKMNDGDEPFVDNDDDTLSETSSISSASSSRGGKSGKGSLATRQTRRNKKRNLKKYNLKKDSANEDIALRKSIKELIEEVQNYHKEAAEMIRWLYKFEETSKAMECQKTFSSILDYIDTEVKLLWPEDEYEGPITNYGLTNSDNKLRILKLRYLQEPSVLVPPKINTKPWKLTLIQD